MTSGEEAKKLDPEKQVNVLDLEREKERVDDEAAEELLVMKKDAVSGKTSVQSEKLVSEKMEARAKENDNGAGMRRNSEGKGGRNRGGNKGKKKKEKM